MLEEIDARLAAIEAEHVAATGRLANLKAELRGTTNRLLHLVGAHTALSDLRKVLAAPPPDPSPAPAGDDPPPAVPEE